MNKSPRTTNKHLQGFITKEHQDQIELAKTIWDDEDEFIRDLIKNDVDDDFNGLKSLDIKTLIHAWGNELDVLTSMDLNQLKDDILAGQTVDLTINGNFFEVNFEELFYIHLSLGELLFLTKRSETK